MSDFLSRFTARVRGDIPALQPRMVRYDGARPRLKLARLRPPVVASDPYHMPRARGRQIFARTLLDEPDDWQAEHDSPVYQGQPTPVEARHEQMFGPQPSISRSHESPIHADTAAEIPAGVSPQAHLLPDERTTPPGESATAIPAQPGAQAFVHGDLFYDFADPSAAEREPVSPPPVTPTAPVVSHYTDTVSALAYEAHTSAGQVTDSHTSVGLDNQAAGQELHPDTANGLPATLVLEPVSSWHGHDVRHSAPPQIDGMTADRAQKVEPSSRADGKAHVNPVAALPPVASDVAKMRTIRSGAVEDGAPDLHSTHRLEPVVSQRPLDAAGQPVVPQTHRHDSDGVRHQPKPDTAEVSPAAVPSALLHRSQENAPERQLSASAGEQTQVNPVTTPLPVASDTVEERTSPAGAVKDGAPDVHSTHRLEPVVRKRPLDAAGQLVVPETHRHVSDGVRHQPKPDTAEVSPAAVPSALLHRSQENALERQLSASAGEQTQVNPVTKPLPVASNTTEERTSLADAVWDRALDIQSTNRLEPVVSLRPLDAAGQSVERETHDQPDQTLSPTSRIGPESHVARSPRPERPSSKIPGKPLPVQREAASRAAPQAPQSPRPRSDIIAGASFPTTAVVAYQRQSGASAATSSVGTDAVMGSPGDAQSLTDRDLVSQTASVLEPIPHQLAGDVIRQPVARDADNRTNDTWPSTSPPDVEPGVFSRPSIVEHQPTTARGARAHHERVPEWHEGGRVQSRPPATLEGETLSATRRAPSRKLPGFTTEAPADIHRTLAIQTASADARGDQRAEPGMTTLLKPTTRQHGENDHASHVQHSSPESLPDRHVPGDVHLLTQRDTSSPAPSASGQSPRDQLTPRTPRNRLPILYGPFAGFTETLRSVHTSRSLPPNFTDTPAAGVLARHSPHGSESADRSAREPIGSAGTARSAASPAEATASTRSTNRQQNTQETLASASPISLPLRGRPASDDYSNVNHKHGRLESNSPGQRGTMIDAQMDTPTMRRSLKSRLTELPTALKPPGKKRYDSSFESMSSQARNSPRTTTPSVVNVDIDQITIQADQNPVQPASVRPAVPILSLAAYLQQRDAERS